MPKPMRYSNRFIHLSQQMNENKKLIALPICLFIAALANGCDFQNSENSLINHELILKGKDYIWEDIGGYQIAGYTSALCNLIYEKNISQEVGQRELDWYLKDWEQTSTVQAYIQVMKSDSYIKSEVLDPDCALKLNWPAPRYKPL